jgi:predicted Fe-Mo cluster-binding NifX family protein
LIINTDTDALEVLDNSAAVENQGAGISATQLVSDKGVEGILTGRVGPNASKAFQAAGITLYEGVSLQERVKEAVTKLKNGEYSNNPTAAGGAPQGQGKGRGLGQGKRNLTAQSNNNLSFSAVFFRISPVDHYDLQIKNNEPYAT